MANTSHLRAWLEVDYSAICANAVAIRSIVGEKINIMAVLKANACQQEVGRVYRAISGVCNSYAMATLDEALQLESICKGEPILVFGYIPPTRYPQLLGKNIHVTVHSIDTARCLSDFAVNSGETITAHIKVDTGMSRLGFSCDEAGVSQIEEVYQLPGLKWEGIFSHLATADDKDTTFALKQQKDFCGLIDHLSAKGLSFNTRGLHNSAGILALPIDSQLNTVRPGLALFGLHPSGQQLPPQFAPAMAFRCRVAGVKTIQAGTGVSYGHTFVAQRVTNVATLSAGYADGVPIGLSVCGCVLINGQRVPILGRVCMDMMMVDVTDLPNVAEGDVATIFGKDGLSQLHPAEVAATAGTICHELLTGITARAERVEVRNSKCETKVKG